MRSIERAVLAVREQPVEQRRPRVADVQLTGRAGSESDAHHSDSSIAVGVHVGVTAQQRDGVSGNRFAAADRVDAFVASCP